MTVGKLTSPLNVCLGLGVFIDIAGALVVRGDGSGFFFGFFSQKSAILKEQYVLFRKNVHISDFELISVEKGHKVCFHVFK